MSPISTPNLPREDVVEKLILAFGRGRSLLPDVQLTGLGQPAHTRQFARVFMFWSALTALLTLGFVWPVVGVVVAALGLKGVPADAALVAGLTICSLPTLFFLWFRLPAKYLRWRMRAACEVVEAAIRQQAATVTDFDEAYRRSPARDTEWLSFGLRRELRSVCLPW